MNNSFNLKFKSLYCAAFRIQYQIDEFIGLLVLVVLSVTITANSYIRKSSPIKIFLEKYRCWLSSVKSLLYQSNKITDWHKRKCFFLKLPASWVADKKQFLKLHCLYNFQRLFYMLIRRYVIGRR